MMFLISVCVCVWERVKGQWQGKAACSLCGHGGKGHKSLILSLKHDQGSSRNIPTGSNALSREDTKWVKGNGGHICLINQEKSGYLICMFCFKVYKINTLSFSPQIMPMLCWKAFKCDQLLLFKSDCAFCNYFYLTWPLKLLSLVLPNVVWLIQLYWIMYLSWIKLI